MDKDKEWKREGGLKKEEGEQGPPPPEGFGGERNRSSLEGEDEDTPKEVIEVGGMEMERGEDVLLLLPQQPPTTQEMSEVNGRCGARDVQGVKATSSSSSPVNAHVGETETRSGKGSSADPVEGGDEAHPAVFNEDVLDNVFKNFMDQRQPGSSKDVQNIRLVCKIWRNSVTRQYRQRERSTVTFYEYRLDPIRRHLKSISEFVDTMKSSQMVPIQKYSFIRDVFEGRNLKLFGDFLRICGPEAVSLDLPIGLRDAGKILLAVGKIPDLSIPNLKSLFFSTFESDDRLRGQHLFEPGQIHGIVKLLERLLSAGKSLREFTVAYYPDVDYPTYDQQVIVMEQLGEVTARRIPRTLKKLTMCTCMSESSYNILAEAGLKLAQLNVRVYSEMGSGALCKFFQSQASTLKQAYLWNEYGEETLVELPRMDELTSLKLSSILVSVGMASDFANTFPKLHAVAIDDMSREGMSALLSRVKRSPPTLKVLDLPRGRNTFLEPIIKNLWQSFRFLVELHIWLYSAAKETMEEVCKYFQNLETLSITFGSRVIDHLDSIFTGISKVDCDRIRRKFPDLRMANLSEFQRTPSLLNLTKLKKLVVYKFGSPPIAIADIAVTDVSAHFVFLEMANLREIHLTNMEMEFSPRYAELLKDKLVPWGI